MGGGGGDPKRARTLEYREGGVWGDVIKNVLREPYIIQNDIFSFSSFLQSKKVSSFLLPAGKLIILKRIIEQLSRIIVKKNGLNTHLLANFIKICPNYAQRYFFCHILHGVFV